MLTTTQQSVYERSKNPPGNKRTHLHITLHLHYILAHGTWDPVGMQPFIILLADTWSI